MRDMEATTVERIMVDEFFCRYGMPDCLHSDQGRNFEFNVVREMCSLLGITKTRTTPYHPQSDGLVERLNRTLLAMLSIAAGEDECNWDLHLPKLMFAYRTSVQETTRSTPFSLMFGREVKLPIDLMFPLPEQPPTSHTQYARLLKDHLQTSYEQVRKHMGVQQRRQKEVFDIKPGGAGYKVGDLVWMHSPAVPCEHSRKLHRPWQGPFVVRKEINDVVYRIQRLAPARQRLVVNFNRLKPYQGRIAEETSSLVRFQPEPEFFPLYEFGWHWAIHVVWVSFSCH